IPTAPILDSVPQGKKINLPRTTFKKGRGKDEACEDSARHASVEKKNNDNSNTTTNGNGIFKMRGFNLSRGNLMEKRGSGENANNNNHDDDVGEAESTTAAASKTTSARAGSGGGGGVNGSGGGGGHGQGFMGVGKDGMWISRKNFQRT
ncbi:MAG: hypothetical protein Q9197_001411, partial [Variospora fuerteventurae]